MDDLVNYEKTDRENLGLEVPPKGKHVFGMVKVGDKGQIVIPANARKIFDIQPGDNLLILGDEEQGIAILKEKSFLEHLRLMERMRHMESGEWSNSAENTLPAPNTAKLNEYEQVWTIMGLGRKAACKELYADLCVDSTTGDYHG